MSIFYKRDCDVIAHCYFSSQVKPNLIAMLLTLEALYVKAGIVWKDIALSLVERLGVEAGMGWKDTALGWKDMALSDVER